MKTDPIPQTHMLPNQSTAREQVTPAVKAYGITDEVKTIGNDEEVTPAPEIKDYAIFKNRNNTRARDKIVRDHIPLVRTLAEKIRKTVPRSVTFDDLMSAGLLGLVEAIQQFNPYKGKSFKKYAELRVRGKILDELRKCDPLSRGGRKEARRIQQARQELETSGKSQDSKTVAKMLGMDLEQFYGVEKDVTKSVELCLDDPENLYEPSNSEENHEYCRTNGAFPEKDLFRKEEYLELGRQMLQLPDSLFLVFSLRVFSSLSFREIAAIVHISESRAFQLTQQAAELLRKRVHNATLDSITMAG